MHEKARGNVIAEKAVLRGGSIFIYHIAPPLMTLHNTMAIAIVLPMSSKAYLS